MKKIFTIIIFTTLFLSAFVLAENVLAYPCKTQTGGDCVKGISDLFVCPDGRTTLGGLSECETGCPEGANNCGAYLCCKTSTTPAAAPSSGTATSGTVPSAGADLSTRAVNVANLAALGFSGTIPVLIGNIVKSILSFVGAFALLMVVYGGILLLTSHGAPEGIGKGKKVITWAIIGVGVILGSYALVDFVIKGIEGGGASTPSTSAGTGQTANACTSAGGRCDTESACDFPEEKNTSLSGCTSPQVCCVYPCAFAATGANCVDTCADPVSTGYCASPQKCCLPAAAAQPSKKCESGDRCLSCATYASCQGTPGCASYSLPIVDGTGLACANVCCTPEPLSP